MVELCVCIGSSCHLKGSYNVMLTFQQMIEEYALHEKITLKSAFCMRECQRPGVQVTVDGISRSVPAEAARDFFEKEILPLL